ncbi:MAG: type II toxin-antitoxin system HicA family toxin [Deltaproteobacteria bacterium]|nr:type II toxin-antitoxin system HicA family toxin [Deltaproteobacteria bacterium]
MPSLNPISHRNFLKVLRKFGFSGPYSGGKHLFMQKADLTLTVPNPHKSDIGVELLKRILKQAGISNKQWIKVNQNEK